MRPSPPSEARKFAYAFGITLAITLIIYLLRGFGILTFFPGGVIYLLILLSIGTGLVYGIQKTRRF
ncbi:MAG: hypothetical protein F6K16_10190 [Symploca sp. SIO2B6]|nr:hypothetical protein [Symploca sp. SIO2B6]